MGVLIHTLIKIHSLVKLLVCVSNLRSLRTYTSLIYVLKIASWDAVDMIDHGNKSRVKVERPGAGMQSNAQSALAASPIYALRELHVEQNNDSLFISGRVGSYYYKQLAQEAVRAVAEGYRVINSIDVESSAIPHQ